MLRLWKYIPSGGNMGQSLSGLGLLASMLGIQIVGREMGQISPPENQDSHSPYNGTLMWHPAASLVLTVRTQGCLPATRSWGAVHILMVRPERPLSPPHPFYLHPSNYATPPDPAFYPFYPGLSACSPKQAGLSRWRLLRGPSIWHFLSVPLLNK